MIEWFRLLDAREESDIIKVKLKSGDLQIQHSAKKDLLQGAVYT